MPRAWKRWLHFHCLPLLVSTFAEQAPRWHCNTLKQCGWTLRFRDNEAIAGLPFSHIWEDWAIHNEISVIHISVRKGTPVVGNCNGWMWQPCSSKARWLWRHLTLSEGSSLPGRVQEVTREEGELPQVLTSFIDTYYLICFSCLV